MQIYETTAKSIINGTTDFEEGVRDISRQTKQGSAKVRDRLRTMVDALTATAKAKVEERETAHRENAEKRTERKPRIKGQPRGPRKEWVEPERFAEIRDKYGLSNTAIAVAMGKSPSRMTELTRGTKATQGGSIDVFNAFVAACEDLASLKEEASAE